MRLFRWLMMASGVVICLGTLAAWYWVAAFGCGMSTAGCNGFSMPMPWEDPELFGVLGPFLGLGFGLLAVGKWAIPKA